MIKELNTKNHKIKSFQPVIDKSTRVLILGSMPGVASLERQEYYGNIRNTFWKIIFEIFNQEPILNYEQKLGFLRSKRIGLWDVLASCERKGSLDSNISLGVVNDLETIFCIYPNIKRVFFNGTKAYDVFKKEIGFTRFDNIVFKKLPSTSPANTLRYEFKLEEWKVLNH